MWKTLIYYKPEHFDIAKKLQGNYLAHKKISDIISEDKQDDIEYAIAQQYDEAIFIEDSETVIIHKIKSGYTNRCNISEVWYQ